MQTSYISLPLTIWLNEKQRVIIDSVDNGIVHYHSDEGEDKTPVIGNKFFISLNRFTVTGEVVDDLVISYKVEVPVPTYTYLLLNDVIQNTKESKV